MRCHTRIIYIERIDYEASPPAASSPLDGRRAGSNSVGLERFPLPCSLILHTRAALAVLFGLSQKEAERGIFTSGRIAWQAHQRRPWDVRRTHQTGSGTPLQAW